jgi:hypothetical protein
MRQNDPEFDRRFEQALCSYADPAEAGQPEMLTSLALAKVESAERIRRRWKLALIFIVPEFVLLTLWLLFLSPHPVRLTAVAPQTVAPSTPRTASQQVAHNHPLAAAHAPLTHAVAIVRQQKHVPKLDQFPTPTPLNEQEQLLVSFVTEVPYATQQSIAESMQQADHPLHIAELSIAPITLNTQP